MEALDITLVGILISVGMIAGFFDAIAGGGGLLTVPALLTLGIPPIEALATNKLQGSIGSFSASLHFVREGFISLSIIWPAVLCTFLGAVAGTVLLQWVEVGVLNNLIPLLVGVALVYFMVSPRMTDIESNQRISLLAFSLIFGTSIGFYDGFFGPGTGSYFVLTCVALLGLGVTSATAHAKVLNFSSNFASLLLFIVGGKVLWTVGLLMGAGQFFGARLGAHIVIGSGVKVVKPALVLICAVLIAHFVVRNSGAAL
jgi:uncharacterized membrane protein YfcA